MSKLATRPPAGGQHGGYGWVPDLPDHRDALFAFAPDPSILRKLATITSLDLSTDKAMPSIWNQLKLGSCTAHSVGAAFAFAHRKAKHAKMMPSRLWIYWQERFIEGTVGQDAGAQIRDGFKVCATVGVPPESDWPYDIATFTNPPSTKAKTDAVKHKSLIYHAVPQNLTSLKAALASGFPVSFGFTVYESFESQEVAQTGIVPMPTANESVLGGHAVLIVGFDDAKQMFLVRNSWGLDWGAPDHPGHFWMPYSYVLSPSLASDFWTVTLAS